MSPAGRGPRAVIVALVAVGGCAGAEVRAAAPCPAPWPLWEAFAERFISPDGRVVDDNAEEHSTSEGQGYGLFFALVAGDRPRFELLLRWTEANLAAGDLAARLPAWRWGRLADGRWGVLDPNAAADADLWIAYALLEAARLWERPAWAATGRALLARVVAEEVRALPGLGAALLPGPRGFTPDERTTRLNPSYLPIQLARRFAAAGAPGPWEELADGSVRALGAVAPHGFAPDWCAWRAGEGAALDPVHGALGSYDAIRVPLWAATLAPDDPLAPALAQATRGYADAWRRLGFVPERVDTRAAGGGPELRPGPVGFLAALLPGVGPGEAAALRAQIEATRAGALYGARPYYYDHALLLFGLGFAEGRYRFLADGALAPAWRTACPAR